MTLIYWLLRLILLRDLFRGIICRFQIFSLQLIGASPPFSSGDRDISALNGHGAARRVPLNLR